MIKSIEIKNAFGIKEQKLDFQIKNLHMNYSLSNQVFDDNGTPISLIPTLLGKNASGKTSLIKAVSFALMFADKEKTIDEISFYVFSQLRNEQKKWGDTDEINMLGQTVPWTNIISMLFNEISFVGSDRLEIKINLINGRKINVEMDNETFYVQTNNCTTNIADILREVFMKKPTLHQGKQELLRSTKQVVEKYEMEFYKGMTVKSILKGSARTASMNSINLKHHTRAQLNSITEHWGFDAISTILKKIDDNIESIEYDIDSKTTAIFLKNISVPITATNLSFGTQKIIEILYKSMDILSSGGIMFIDEIENGLHKSLIKLIVDMFSNESINKGHAQLIMTTHLPMLFEELVLMHNAFLNDGHSFIRISDDKASDRTEKQKAMIKPKNYYNDFFWYKNDSTSKSTISNVAINLIIDKLSERADRFA